MDGFFTLVRVLATATGLIVWLMWLLGTLDLAQFVLIFRLGGGPGAAR